MSQVHALTEIVQWIWKCHRKLSPAIPDADGVVEFLDSLIPIYFETCTKDIQTIHYFQPDYI